MGSFLPRHWSLWRDCHSVDSYLPLYDYHYCSQSRTCLWDSRGEKKKERNKTRRRKERIEKRIAVGKQQHDAMRRKIEIQHRDMQTVMQLEGTGLELHISWSVHTTPCAISLKTSTANFAESCALGEIGTNFYFYLKKRNPQLSFQSHLV